MLINHLKKYNQRGGQKPAVDTKGLAKKDGDAKKRLLLLKSRLKILKNDNKNAIAKIVEQRFFKMVSSVLWHSVEIT